MLFSIVICVNRDTGFLKPALDSVISQDYELPYEILVVANNCTDSLWDYLNDEYKKNKLVKLYRTNIGQLCFNLNYAINIAQGDYIVRMDADDISLHNRLSILDKKLSSCPDIDVIGSAVELVDESDNHISYHIPPLSCKEIMKSYGFKNPFVHPTTCIRRSLLLSVGGYLGGFQSEDYDLWLRLIRKQGVNFRNIEDVTLQYRINPEQSRGNKLPYAEVSAHFLREFILSPSFKGALYLLSSFIKSFIFPNK